MNYTRQEEIFHPRDLVWPVTIIGVGGIGSAAALALAKLGVIEFHLYDPDIVEEENLPNQILYKRSDLGVPKALAAKKHLTEFGVDPARIFVYVERVERERQELSGVVICAVDSMAAREVIWRAVRRAQHSVYLYMDGRIGGEYLELYTLNPCKSDHADHYEFSLFPDEKAPNLPCGGRAIIYPAMTIAALMANQLVRYSRAEDFSVFVQMAFENLDFIRERG